MSPYCIISALYLYTVLAHTGLFRKYLNCPFTWNKCLKIRLAVLCRCPLIDLLLQLKRSVLPHFCSTSCPYPVYFQGLTWASWGIIAPWLHKVRQIQCATYFQNMLRVLWHWILANGGSEIVPLPGCCSTCFLATATLNSHLETQFVLKNGRHE